MRQRRGVDASSFGGFGYGYVVERWSEAREQVNAAGCFPNRRDAGKLPLHLLDEYRLPFLVDPAQRSWLWTASQSRTRRLRYPFSGRENPFLTQPSAALNNATNRFKQQMSITLFSKAL
jgi:hypothetical protein